MDLQSRKISFIEEYLSLSNVEIIEKLEKILRQERMKAFKAELKPMTQKELEKGIEEAENDIENGRVYTTKQMKELFKNKYSRK